eukprot:4349964-Amphidinium_carterae.1
MGCDVTVNMRLACEAAFVVGAHENCAKHACVDLIASEEKEIVEGISPKLPRGMIASLCPIAGFDSLYIMTTALQGSFSVLAWSVALLVRKQNPPAILPSANRCAFVKSEMQRSMRAWDIELLVTNFVNSAQENILRNHFSEGFDVPKPSSPCHLEPKYFCPSGKP